jgi:hypothetical protein
MLRDAQLDRNERHRTHGEHRAVRFHRRFRGRDRYMNIRVSNESVFLGREGCFDNRARKPAITL